MESPDDLFRFVAPRRNTQQATVDDVAEQLGKLGLANRQALLEEALPHLLGRDMPRRDEVECLANERRSVTGNEKRFALLVPHRPVSDGRAVDESALAHGPSHALLDSPRAKLVVRLRYPEVDELHQHRVRLVVVDRLLDCVGLGPERLYLLDHGEGLPGVTREPVPAVEQQEVDGWVPAANQGERVLKSRAGEGLG